MRTLGLIGGLVLVTFAGVAQADDARARFHWIMNCQGCHQADASGSAGGAPSMAGVVSKFLSVEGGRDYLGRVPGVAFAPLGDADLAELLNWSLRTFDSTNLPGNFSPYTADEVGRLRAVPLVSDAAEQRSHLAAKFGTH